MFHYYICWGPKPEARFQAVLEPVQMALKPSSSIEGRQEEATYLPVATVQP